jgi:hypothetical protein
LEASDQVAAIEADGFVEVELTLVYWDQEAVEVATEEFGLIDTVDAGCRLAQSVLSAKVVARKPS